MNCSFPNAHSPATHTQSGNKLTPMQQQVYEQTKASVRPIRASDLLAGLKSEAGQITPSLVYHALERLVELKLLHKLKSLNAYVACTKPGCAHDSQFLICEHCGKATELVDATLATALLQDCAAEGFKASQQIIEVTGLCQACQSKPG